MSIFKKPARMGLSLARATVRSQKIAWVVSRYALAESFASIGIEVGARGLSVAKKVYRPKKPLDEVFGKKLTKCLIHLGPTFIKLGQMLATRPDFVGEAVAFELQVLFERVPAISYSKIKKILINELGRNKVKTAFKSIDPIPLASASLGQTHRAELSDGTPVILKIQKKGCWKNRSY